MLVKRVNLFRKKEKKRKNNEEKRKREKNKKVRRMEKEPFGCGNSFVSQVGGVYSFLYDWCSRGWYSFLTFCCLFCLLL